MPNYLLQETADRLLQETGFGIILDEAVGYYLWISDTSYATARLESFSFTEAANQGEVGVGGFNLDDVDLTMSVPALKAMSFTDFRASTGRIFTGYTHNRTTQRGPNAVAGQREWSVECADVNTIADDFILTDFDRSAETDYARVTALRSTVFGTVGLVTAGVVPNTNTVSMDAIDYRGRTAREVLDQCAEITGKTWFIYQHAITGGPLLYYDLATGTSLTSSAKISDVAADVDSSTVWAPIGPPTVVRTPDEIYSTVHLTWSGGVVTVSNATTLANYRRREISLLDMGCRTSTTATAKANAFLAASATERTVVSDISVRLPAANVNDIRAGQRLQIKLTRHGISAYTYYRVTRRTVRPLPGQSGVSDVEYLVTYSMVDTNAPTRYLYQRGSNEVWEVKSNATDDGASVIVNRSGITVTSGAISVKNASGNTLIDGTTASGTIQNSAATTVINSSGLTITNGAITVTNAGAVVIIDGTSNMFKIVATGTATVTCAASTGATTTTAVSGTGLASSTTPAYIAYLTEGTSPAVTANRDLAKFVRGRLAAPEGFASSTVGAATNFEFLPLWYYGTSHSGVSGTDPAINVGVNNADTASAHDFYMRWHLLKESAI